MARAKRHYIPGYTWHLTHRCHKNEFLLKFVKDRRVCGDRESYIHLLLFDVNGQEVISKSIQLVAGRTGQEHNQRKSRKGAFWEDRYHATAVEHGDHLIRYLVYVDLNMVRGWSSKSSVCVAFQRILRDPGAW